MKFELTKTTLLIAAIFSSSSLFAQAQEVSGSNYFLYVLVAVAVLIFFALVIQVANNLLAIEAKQVGANRNRVNYSIFPAFKELFAPKLPDYVGQEPVSVLSRGHDILLEGAPEEAEAHAIKSKTYAIQPPNFIGNYPIPKMLVEVGAEVKAGDPLFFDKGAPEIKYAAPVSGEVIAVNRGAKRSIAEVVILADSEVKSKTYEAFDLENGSREALVNYLAESGVWPMIRQRPFNVVPALADIPRDIFISTFDTAPLAPDLSIVVEGREAAFQKGLDVLNKLTPGTVFLGLNARNNTAPSTAFTQAEGVEFHWFHGKHPAGNVGVQIHHIKPLASGDKVWTLGVQEVITLGALFLNQVFDTTRVVALTGDELKEPKYVHTYLGANLGDLLADNLKREESIRIISGDVLTGAVKNKEHFINFYDDQITVIEEGDYYEMFGWLIPVKPRPSISRTFPGFVFPDLKFKADTNTHGEERAFVVTGQYESVLPMDIYPQHLMKAILVNDFERMEGLGIHELVEEDIALCEFVCTSKQPLQQILREGLEVMREQG